jgi:hypothetical protein
MSPSDPMRRAFTRFGTLIDCRFQDQKHHGSITVHPRAGRRRALIDRLLITARRAGLDPAHWLEDVLRRIPTATTANLHELLPANWKPATA